MRPADTDSNVQAVQAGDAGKGQACALYSGSIRSGREKNKIQLYCRSSPGLRCIRIYMFVTERRPDLGGLRTDPAGRTTGAL